MRMDHECALSLNSSLENDKQPAHSPFIPDTVGGHGGVVGVFAVGVQKFRVHFQNTLQVSKVKMSGSGNL